MSLRDICSFVYALVVDAGPSLGDIEDACDEMDALLGSAQETPRSDRAMIATTFGGG